MLRVRISRWVNSRIFRGRPDQMLCSRLHVERRYLLIDLADLFWFCFTLSDDHCRRCHHWEMKEKVRAQADEGSDQAQEEASRPKQT